MGSRLVVKVCDGVNIGCGAITLRGVEPSDVDVMYGIENDVKNWGLSGTTQPFSHFMLEAFVESQLRGDIFATRQLRLMVEGLDGDIIGVVDLFEFEPLHHRAGVGIYILEPFRGQGYGTQILDALHRYCKEVLQLHQLWCSVAAENDASLKLFRGVGYQDIGVRKDWLWQERGYCDEILLQRLL